MSVMPAVWSGLVKAGFLFRNILRRLSGFCSLLHLRRWRFGWCFCNFCLENKCPVSNDKNVLPLEEIVDSGIHLAKTYAWINAFCWAFMFVALTVLFFAIFVFKIFWGWFMRHLLKSLIDDVSRIVLSMYFVLLLAVVVFGIPIFYFLFFVL